MFSETVLGVAPWVIIASLVTWGVTVWQMRLRAEEKREKTAKEVIDRGERLEIHRDELTFELLQTARGEMTVARVEMEDLRDEVRKLRKMELHFYHFQQSLDHLEALIFAETDVIRATAERNARAFLTRMRRLTAAKGTIANEAQRAASEVHVAEQNLDDIETVDKDFPDAPKP